MKENENERLERLSQNQELLKQLINSLNGENPESIELNVEEAERLSHKIQREAEEHFSSGEEDDDNSHQKL